MNRYFTSKSCQIVAVTNMTHQFQEFFESHFRRVLAISDPLCSSSSGGGGGGGLLLQHRSKQEEARNAWHAAAAVAAVTAAAAVYSVLA